MATWYIDNVGGNNANAGNSTAAAKATLDAYSNFASLAAGDIIRIKSTGVDYSVSNAPSASTPIFSTNGSTSIAVVLTNYVTDTTKPTLIINANTANTNVWNTTIYYAKNVKIILDKLTQTATAYPWVNALQTGGGYFYNCEFLLRRTGQSATTNYTFNTNFNTMSNCVIDGGSLSEDRNIWTAATQSQFRLITGCIITNFIAGTTPLNNTGTYTKNIFINNGVISSSTAQGTMMRAASTAVNFTNNTVIMTDDSRNIANTNAFWVPGTGDGITTGSIYNDFSNIYVSLRTATTYVYNTTAPNAPTIANTPSKNGNNAWFGFNAYINNIDLTAYASLDNYYLFGLPIALSSNPFLSTTIGNANFAKIDTSSSGGLQVIGAAFNDSNMDLGAKQSSGSGAVPNDYDLRLGVTVGSVVGTLVIPATSTVETGTNYDAGPNAKTGIYTGANRWSDPGVANVTLAVAYKANSLTNNRTGTNESTDPGVANVVAGINYKINSTSHTGTRTSIYALLAANLVKIGQDRGDGTFGTYVAAERYSDPGIANVKTGTSYLYNASTLNGSLTVYPLLALNLVKIGQDRGDGSFGTYDGAERYSDLDLSQIVSGYNFRYNSLTNNRSGTRTSIYALLAQANVKSGIDRGDGTFGTDKGESFNSILTDSQIAIGETIQNLGNTINGAYTASERYTDIDLTKVNDTYEFRYNSLTNNREGTRTAIYDLLPINIVAIGEDRGDGEEGTYTATERYSELDQNDVKDGVAYRYNSLVDNKEGNYLAYELLPIEDVAIDVDRGDGQLGIYVAAERYTFLEPVKVIQGEQYLYNNEEFTGEAQAGDADYPADDKVLFPTTFANGTRIGQLGKFNTDNLDYVAQIQNNAELIMTNILGSEWGKLKYFKEVNMNDFWSNAKQYGIRALQDERTFDVVNKETIDIDYELKLTTDFVNHEGDDAERAAELFLITKSGEIRTQLRMTKFGNFNNIRNVKFYVRDEVEKVTGKDVLVCRSIITVSYGIN